MIVIIIIIIIIIIHLRKWDALNSLGFSDTNGSSNFGQTTRLTVCQEKKKRTFRIIDFAVPADDQVKLKESEKRDP